MDRLREIRKAKGLRVMECAAALGVPRWKWDRWENLTTDPKRSERNRIADFLGVTLDQLAGRAPYQAPQAA